MAESVAIVNRRVLVVDDNPAIHKDFRKVLGAGIDEAAALEADELALFGESAPAPNRPNFEVDSALQGRDGVERVRQALRAGRPGMAAIDVFDREPVLDPADPYDLSRQYPGANKRCRDSHPSRREKALTPTQQ